MTKARLIPAVTAGLTVLLGSCGPAGEKRTVTELAATTPAPQVASPIPVGSPGAAGAAEESQGVPQVAIVDLRPLAGSGVAGSVTFTERDGQVEVNADLTGLAAGEHGFHVHEVGDCSAADGSSAGPHFNPGGEEHGPFDPSVPHHAGDLGNAVADATGHARLTARTPQFTVAPGARSVVGRSVVVHEKRDDLRTQPAGDAGKRLACGVVVVMGAEAATPSSQPAGTP